MRHRLLVPIVATLALHVLATTARAQGAMFVVDAANGPGAHYTDLQTAVTAVPDGSVLLVRAGVYAQVAITGKALAVLGGTGVDVSGEFHVLNLQPSQKVAVRAVRVVGTVRSIRIADAAGPVSWDGAGTTVSSLVIANSRQVHVRDLDVVGVSVFGVPHSAPATVTANSSAVLERCDLTGLGLGNLEMSQACSPALQVLQSSVQLVETSATGGNGGQAWSPFGTVNVPGAPAVWLAGGALRALGVQPLLGGTYLVQAPAIDGTGTARVDPLLPLAGPTGAGIALTRPHMPQLVADDALPGGTITVTRSGPAGSLCAIAVSLRGPVTALPPLPDPVWVQAASLVVEAAAVVPASGTFAVQKAVPAVPALLGFELVWQAADFDSTGQLALSNPSPSVVR